MLRLQTFNLEFYSLINKKCKDQLASLSLYFLGKHPGGSLPVLGAHYFHSNWHDDIRTMKECIGCERRTRGHLHSKLTWVD